MNIITKMAKLIIDEVTHIIPTGDLYIGKDIRVGDNVIIKSTEEIKNPIKLIVEGDARNINTIGNVEVSGKVDGYINTMGSVTCEDVGGNINTMGSVRARSVGGSIETMGPITINN